MCYIYCNVFQTKSHDALLIVWKDHGVDHHLLVEIMKWMTETQLNKTCTKRKRMHTKNKYLNLNVTVNQQLFKSHISGAKYQQIDNGPCKVYEKIQTLV